MIIIIIIIFILIESDNCKLLYTDFYIQKRLTLRFTSLCCASIFLFIHVRCRVLSLPYIYLYSLRSVS